MFYAVALWAAITLNFALPRLMPGSPLDGLILRYQDVIRSNPGILQQLKAQLGWFPIQHAYGNETNVGFNWAFLTDAFRHAELPVLVIIAVSAGGWLLGMRNVMINTVAEDYVTMAQAKGLRDRRVMARYAARNAILPPLTGFASFFASAVGGLILVEYVFSYPGVGLTIQQAALGHDYPLVQALLLLLAVCVLVANLIMDLVYAVLDPRVRAA